MLIRNDVFLECGDVRSKRMVRSSVLLVVWTAAIILSAVQTTAGAVWPASGEWPVWGAQPAQITPVPWPQDDDWISYTASGSPLADPSVADPSNGGTSPQNYVSVTSNCPDKTLPSVYWAFDATNEVVFFRFRLSAVPNTYATGPSAGSASASDPWRSAQWSVLMDIDGDGYREFAVQLDGSTGSPGDPVDRLSIIFSATQSNSLDYTEAGSGIYLVNQYPTAFVDTAGGTILNFHDSNSPDAIWPNGNSETFWDYGLTRSTNITIDGCTEYITDYQIPLTLLDATDVGGPAISANDSMAYLFATANSLQNPFQKDVITTGDEVYIGNPVQPAPFGDSVTVSGGESLPQAVVSSVTASGCGPASLAAVVNDAIQIVDGYAVTTVREVEFFYYEDTDGNGTADDANVWTLIGGGSTSNSPIGTWTAGWNSSSLPQGRYLVGAKATDGQGNITWSWEAEAGIGLIGPTPPNYANPIETGPVYAVFTNLCGAPPPYAVKTSNATAPLSPGAPVTFTITVYNTSASEITVDAISDDLPSGFTYQSTAAGTLGAPSNAPTPGDTGILTWTFPPAAIPAGSNRTLVFTCNVAAVAGTYSNAASVDTSVGTLNTEPTQVSVGSPQLTITKRASSLSVAPGDALTYTIGYANTSPVNVTGVTVTDVLPEGLAYISSSAGGLYTDGTRAVSWSIGTLAAGESGSVSVTTTVVDPFPVTASIPLENSASLSSTESGTVTASTRVLVNTPRPILSVQKSTSPSTVSENSDVTFTLAYANTGNAAATSLTLTDTIPSGTTFVSATGGGTESGGTVTWNLAELAPNSTGSVSVTLHVPSAYAGDNPLINTVALTADGVAPVTDAFRLGVNQITDVCTTYYFIPDTADVGADGVQKIANTDIPAGVGTNTEVITNTDQSYKEALRFYTDPATANAVDFSGDLTTVFYLDRVNGGGITIQTQVYDYDSATGSKVLLGTNEESFNGGDKGQLTPFVVTLAGTLEKGHRLLWVYNVRSNTNGSDTVYLQYGGTVTNPISGGTVLADANASFCVSPPANLIIDKQVDRLTASPGETLAYSILFSNTGQTAATGALVTDTLPAGVSYVGATLNGSAIVPSSVSGQEYTFTINSADTATSGQVSGGQSGSLEITATIDSPLASGISRLENTAVLISDQTSEVTDTAGTTVLRPDVSVTKSVDLALVGPGDTVTYSVSVINTGSGPATNVTIADVLPVQAYFNYVSGSTTLNGSPAADHFLADTLEFNIGTLQAGEAAVVTYQMEAGAGGTFPASQTNLANTAAVTDDETIGSRDSNTVTVTVNPLPNLTLAKSFDPMGPYAAGDIITCNIQISNTGGSDAYGVIVSDPIPVFTNYKIGSLVYAGSQQTDVSGDDTGSFDIPANRAVFKIGTLGSGASRNMSLQITVQYPMTAGTTLLSNTAQATAVNAAGKSATATASIVAQPDLSVAKSGPDSSPYPAAAATADGSGTTVEVDDISPFKLGQYIRVAGQTARITGISGSTLTVDSALNVANGDTVTGSLAYTIQYANSGSADVLGATLVDTLPAGTVFIGATAGGVYAAGPATVTWNIGYLPTGGLGVVEVYVFPSAAGNLTNSVVLTATGAEPASDAVATGVGGLRITKRTSSPEVNGGATATYIIEVTNTSPFTATDVIVTDTLPPGFTYADTVSISGGSRTATADPTAGDTVPSWGAFSLAADEVMTITFRAAVAAGIEGIYDNEVAVSSSNTPVGGFDPLLTTAEDVTVTGEALPEPTGSLTSGGTVSAGCAAALNWTAANASEGTVTPGDISVPVAEGSGSISVAPADDTTYTLSLTGPGGSVSYPATVTVNPAPVISAFTATPASVQSGGAVTFAATYSGGQGIITPGGHPIASGGTFLLSAGPGTTTVYSLTVTAPCGADSQTTANATVTVIPPTPQSDLAIHIGSDAQQAPSPGAQFTYTLLAINHGPDDASNVTVIDELPEEVAYVSDTCNGSFDPQSNIWTWSVGGLSIGSQISCDIIVQAQTTNDGSIVNTAVVEGQESDPNPDNNVSSDSLGMAGQVLEVPALGTGGTIFLVLLIAAFSIAKIKGTRLPGRLNNK